MTPATAKLRPGPRPKQSQTGRDVIVAQALDVLRGSIARNDIEALIAHVSCGGVTPQFQTGSDECLRWYCPDCIDVKSRELDEILEHMLTHHPRGEPNAQRR